MPSKQIPCPKRYGQDDCVSPLKKDSDHLVTCKIIATGGKTGYQENRSQPGGGRIIFTPEPNINAEQLIALIQTQAQCYKFDGADKLKFVKSFETTEQKIEFINGLFEKLALETL